MNFFQNITNVSRPRPDQVGSLQFTIRLAQMEYLIPRILEITSIELPANDFILHSILEKAVSLAYYIPCTYVWGTKLSVESHPTKFGAITIQKNAISVVVEDNWKGPSTSKVDDYLITIIYHDNLALVVADSCKMDLPSFFQSDPDFYIIEPTPGDLNQEQQQALDAAIAQAHADLVQAGRSPDIN